VRTREKNGVQGARDEGMLAKKTPIFSSPPTNFQVIQLSQLSIQPPIRKRHVLFCMTDFMQEYNEASKNKVTMRIFSNQRATSIALIFEIRDTKLSK